MEGGLVTLLLGTMLIVLFTDATPKPAKDRAALYAILIASGVGLLVSGALRDLSLLMSLGLALVAVGAFGQLRPLPKP